MTINTSLTVQKAIKNHKNHVLYYFRGVSHSAMTDMQTIEQEGVESNKFSVDKYERRNNKNSFFEDELDTYTGGFSSGPPKYVLTGMLIKVI